MRNSTYFLVLLIVSTGAGIAVAYSGSRVVYAMSALATVVCLFRMRGLIPLQYRFIFLAVGLSLVNLLSSWIGALAPLAVLVLLLLVVPTKLTARNTSENIILAMSGVLIFVGSLSTGLTAGLTFSMGILVCCLAVAIFILVTAEGEEYTIGYLFLGLVVTGVSGGAVLLSRIAGPLVQSSGDLSRYSSDSASGFRYSGFFSAPNEAALVISAGLLVLIAGIFVIRLTVLQMTLSFVSLALGAGGLIATGSRSSILGALGAAAIMLLLIAIRRPGRFLLGCAALLVSGVFVANAASFGTRSLNVISSRDASSSYRQEVQGQLLQYLDWTRLSGFGFSSGNSLMANPYSGRFPNIDNAWFSALIAFGILPVLGLALFVITGVSASLKSSRGFSLAFLGWVLPVTLAENLWFLLAPSALSILLLSALRTMGENLHADRPSAFEHAVEVNGSDQSSSVGART